MTHRRVLAAWAVASFAAGALMVAAFPAGAVDRLIAGVPVDAAP